MKVARTVLNGESGSNAADLHNIIVENGIKSILQKIFDYYYSYKRTCKTVALGGLIGINDTWLRGMGDKIESIDKLTSGIYSIGEVLNIDGFNDYGLLVVII